MSEDSLSFRTANSPKLLPRGSQSSQASANSLDSANIWFLAARSLSSGERLSGGPSIPTATRPESSPRPEENVNLYDPGPSSTSATCAGTLIPSFSLSTLHLQSSLIKEKP